MKIMFDSNSFDKMCSSEDDLERIVSSNKHEYYITSVQIEELGNIPDCKREKRIQVLLALCKIRAHLLYVPAVLDYARIGHCIPIDENDVYMDLLTESHGNVRDAMIGSTAKRESCAVITNDTRFSKKLNKHSIPAMSYEEFVHSL